MNNIRRVVTGHTEEGKSIIVSDSDIEGVSLGGGKDFIQLWGNDTIPVHPDKGIMDDNMDWFPKSGGHRFFLWTVPPQAEVVDKPKTKTEIDELLPGFTKHFERDSPGMHTTNSVDCTYVVSGSIILELDDQKEIELKEGDSVVQNGTRHRWTNKGEIPAVLITTCIGADRVGK